MSTKKKLLSVLGLAAAASISSSAMAEEHKMEMEKCSIVDADGKTGLLLRDCKTATHSCAGKATDPADWILVPKGTCAKIKGGVVN